MTDQPSPTRSKRRFWLTVLLILGCSIAWWLIIRENRDHRFDAKVWRENIHTLNGSDLRQRMVNDLQRNVLMYGMTRREIVSLLGTSESQFISTDDDMVYRIGSESGTGSMSRFGQITHFSRREIWLALKFNDQGRLVDWRILKQ